MPDLGVAGLVGLNACQRLFEQMGVGAIGQGRHGHELQVGEARFEDEVELDGEVQRVSREEHVVEKVARGKDDPLVGVVRLVRPVEVPVMREQVAADQQRNLGMADLVESAEGRHHPPGAVTAEPSHAQLGDRTGIFGQRDRAVVKFDQLQPTGVEFVDQPWLRQCCTYPADGGVFFPLIRHILPVGGAVGLAPVLPGLTGQPGAAADLFRKEAAFIDVARGPVDLARYVEPVVSSKYHLAASAISVLESYPAAGLSGARSRAAPARSSSGVVKYGFSISIPPTSMRGCVLSRLTMIPAPKRSMS